MVDAPAPADILDRLRPWSVDDWFDEITRLRSLLPPHAPITPGTIAVPEDLLWRVSRHLRTFGLFVASSEMREEIEADRAAVFRLLTEVAPV